MRINPILQNKTNFSGKLILPEIIPPKLEEYTVAIKKSVPEIIKNQPFDVIVLTERHGDKYTPKVKYVRTDDGKVNPFALLVLDDVMSRAENKLILDEIVEQMNKEFADKFNEITKIEIKKDEKIRQKMYIPNIIGKNSQLNNKPKISKENRHIKRF